MSARPIISLVALASVAVGGAAVAADEADGGRYTMSATKDGVMRLDTHTGAMALCQRQAGRWSCQDMDDSQRLLMAEIDKLQTENEHLRNQVEDLEKTLGLNEGSSDTPKPATKFALPSEDDVDKAFDYLEGMLNKLRDRMEKLKDEHERSGGTAL